MGKATMKPPHPTKGQPSRSPVTPATKYLRELLQKFPDTPTLTLAKKAYKEHPALWSNLEACRSGVRKLRGQSGDHNRDRTYDKTLYRPEGPRNPFPALPEGIVDMEDWRIIHIDDPGTWLVMSDMHVPYHDADVIRTIWTEAQKRNIRGVLLNGDVADCFAVSRWEKDPRKRNFRRELETLRQFLEATRQAFPTARIVWKWGNHEERFDSYMQVKAPELLDLPEFDLGLMAGAKTQRIETVRDKQPIQLGKLFVLHGHEYRFAIQNPVNPARGLFMRAQVSAMCGHFHQSSQHSEKNLSEHVTSCWSTGCLCDMRPEYMPLNKWAHGAAFVEVSPDGAFSVQNFRVIDGKIWS